MQYIIITQYDDGKCSFGKVPESAPKCHDAELALEVNKLSLALEANRTLKIEKNDVIECLEAIAEYLK